MPISKLFEDDFVISEGHNRHEGILRVMESLISRNKSGIHQKRKLKNWHMIGTRSTANLR